MLVSALHRAEATMATETEAQSFKSMGVMPWMWGAGLLALMGTSLIGGALRTSAPPPSLAGFAFAGAAALELASGIGLYRRGGAGIAPLFSGALGLGMVGLLFFYWAVVPQSRSAGTVTMLFGIFCLATALARGLDLAIDRPVAPLTEGIAAVTSFAVGVVALAAWHRATDSLIAWLVGIVLMGTAVTLAGAAWALWSHPELPGYQEPIPH
jgi:hypothetical protein